MHPLKTGEEPLFLRVRNARQLFGRQLKHDRLTGCLLYTSPSPRD